MRQILLVAFVAFCIGNLTGRNLQPQAPPLDLVCDIETVEKITVNDKEYPKLRASKLIPYRFTAGEKVTDLRAQRKCTDTFWKIIAKDGTTLYLTEESLPLSFFQK